LKSKYFTININQDNIKFNSELFLLDGNSEVLARDLSGNSIISKKSGVYLFIHDSNPDSIKLFDNIEEFYLHTHFYDDEESSKRYDYFINEHKKEHIQEPEEIPEKLLYISTVVKYIGGKRILEKYKNGSYYNVTQAYIDGTLTKEEFKQLFVL
jgi:hypothetical protein